MTDRLTDALNTLPDGTAAEASAPAHAAISPDTTTGRAAASIRQSDAPEAAEIRRRSWRRRPYDRTPVLHRRRPAEQHA